MFTIFSGFYPTVQLLSSRLLVKSLFNLSLTRNEMIEIAKYRFVNVVLLENIPQFVFQLVYLIDYSDDVNILVLISMLL